MRTRIDPPRPRADDPLWYKDAIIYELHVRSFRDGSGDGIGDFKGLIETLDYLQDLGVTALWLLPFYPSPLRDDGYDIADYARVNPAYGSMRDFKRFLSEAHRRDLRVITELVINHTSSEHPWFQRARRAPAGSREREFYVWTDKPDRYADARIIFRDFETSNWTWDSVAGAYYWHRFYSHQPDLNFDNPEVQAAVFKALDYWMEMGVDGMRLDAVPYLYEREGTICENLPETHEFLQQLRSHIDSKYQGRMLLAEANQWPEDAAAYFGSGNECHMNFHFPLMPRMFMAVQLESSFPIFDILDQTPAIPDACQWALFLRNHDELTLEMVTDEDRDYMYRVYAEDPRARINLGIRRRLAPLLRSRRKVELMNALLMSLPGTPVLYYGDEIGMGDNVYLGDRDGVRTPMQWSADRNAGFSRANPQQLYLPPIIDPEYHYETVNVEAQQNNPSSMLWWMKRLIALRKQTQVFGRGEAEFLHPDNSKVLAFIRSYGDERVLVVANLSRYVQFVELDLSRFEGLQPVELFGLTRFPVIGSAPYFLSLGPHAFFWFAIAPPPQQALQNTRPEAPQLETTGGWQTLVTPPVGGRMLRALEQYVVAQRWFRSKARERKSATIIDVISIEQDAYQLLLFELTYVEGPSETYVVPLAFVSSAEVGELDGAAVVAQVRVRGADGDSTEGALVDAFFAPGFAEALLGIFGRPRRLAGRRGRLTSASHRPLRQMRGDDESALTPHLLGGEQSNTSIVYGDRLFLKLFRLLEAGINPELEIGKFLLERTRFRATPALAGSLSYQGKDGLQATAAVLLGYAPNTGSAWRLCLDALDRYYERVLSGDVQLERDGPSQTLLDAVGGEPPATVTDAMSAMLPLLRQLAEHTAEMHLALSCETDDADFAPERFTQQSRRSLYQSARTRLKRTVSQLRGQLSTIGNDEDRAAAQNLLSNHHLLDAQLKQIIGTPIDAVRIRCHGDYHLGQVLYTGKDFVIIDFEGEPARPINERRFKGSPLRDVAGMLRSFNYAAYWALRHGHSRPADAVELEPWARVWQHWASVAFIGAYLDRSGDAPFIPKDRAALQLLLDFFTLDKCIYELGYELNNRPEWIDIPLAGLSTMLDPQD